MWGVNTAWRIVVGTRNRGWHCHTVIADCTRGKRDPQADLAEPQGKALTCTKEKNMQEKLFNEQIVAFECQRTNWLYHGCTTCVI